MGPRTTRWTVAASLAVALACSDQSITGPVTPPDAAPPRYATTDADDPFAALLGSAEEILLTPELIGPLHEDQSAEGHGSVTFGKKVLTTYSFSFTAQGEDNPKTKILEAKGQFEY